MLAGGPFLPPAPGHAIRAQTPHSLSESSLLAARVMLLGAFFVSAAIYFSWRLTVFNPSFPLYSFLFYLAELIGFTWAVINLFSLLRFKKRASPPAPAGLSVDVFIPTYNEPAEVVRRTALAATRISYPHETWILDDGNRPQMRALADELGCRYLARAENTGAKAGNLNNALRHASGEFMVLFDADFIARPDFLDKTLGYFGDPKVGFVQTPQEFYNFDSYQHLGRNRSRDVWSEHSLFFHAMQRGRDYYNAAMMCGSAAILRRAALDDVGGFADSTVTEDMHTSTLIHAKGWASVYHPETLAAGLAPHDARSFQRQRLRWAQGAMQVARREGLLAGDINLSFHQRLAYLLHVGNYIEGPRHVFLYIASALTLIASISPIHVGFGEWALYTVPFLFLSVFCFEELSRGYARVLKNEIFNMARCPALIRALPDLFRTRHIKFRVTPKIKQKPKPFIFPWAILLLNLFALAVAFYNKASGAPTLEGWPFMIVAMWCAFGAWLSANVCLLTRRCNRNRRAFSRFPVSIPVQLLQYGAEIPAIITELSDHGLSIKPAGHDETLPSGTCRGAFEILGRKITLEVTLRPAAKGARSGGPLAWDSATSRDDYIHAILTDRIYFLDRMTNEDSKTYIGPLAQAIGMISGKIFLRA